jgi:hypothetical protein
MTPLFVTLCLVGQPAAQPHEQHNALYKELLDPGLLVVPNIRAKFPTPTMSDGLDAAKQKAIIAQLIGNDYVYEEFTRKSAVAPQLLKLRDINPSDPQAPARGVDVWFVAHGDFNATDDPKFLERLLNVGRGDGQGKSLTREELAKRKIELPPDAEKREGYGVVEFDFLDKVRIKSTGRATWSKTADSVLVAAVTDPRFLNDPEYPNQWQGITKDATGMKVGPPQPWNGAALYLKITKLHEPAGAMFIEQHVIFVEPHGWFDGANLLRSKLPPVVQTQVRRMRQEWLKGPGGK